VLAPDEIMAMQGDTVSRPARAWAGLLARSGPFDGEAERARALLAGWDGDLRPESGAALLYAYVRRSIARALYEPLVGEEAWRWLMSGEPPALGRMVGQWLAHVIASLDGEAGSTFHAPGSTVEQAGRGGVDAPWNVEPGTWNDILPDALAETWRAAVRKAGADPGMWRWVDHHATNAKHTLAAAFPELAETLTPPRAFVGGDGDTIQCAGYGWSGRADFDITSLSVYRQCVDLSDIAGASFVVPGGVSGLPGTPHYADQLELWRTHRRIPMRYDRGDMSGDARHTLTLAPR
jgi:penicillin amidase